MKIIILKLVWGSPLTNAYWIFEKHINGWYVYPSKVIWHPSFFCQVYIGKKNKDSSIKPRLLRVHFHALQIGKLQIYKFIENKKLNK